MSHLTEQELVARKITLSSLQTLKVQGTRIVMVTAYDYPTGRLADEAGVDLILVGDSLANTALGYDNTLPVTLDEMLVATRAVRRGVKRAMIVADLPFGTFQAGTEEAMRAALRFVKEGGVEAVKVEGGRNRISLVRQMVENGIPVMGHIGLTPQSVLSMGGYKLQGKTLAAARAIIDDARSLEQAGAFALVLEVIPSPLARLVTREIKIPTIGIGAGPGVDGQVLVMNDLLGLNFGHSARFVRRYADLRSTMSEAIGRYAEDVRNSRYPGAQESYDVSQEVAQQLERLEEQPDNDDASFVLFSQ
jgi:3-methyl-2-oxobutanoate hydroxymethyltransferase